MRRPVALLLPWCLVACGDLDVRSVREPQVVPAQLAGEWLGTWQSANQTASGAVVVRVQEFAGEPVVRIEFQNPCLEPRAYELVMTASLIELRAEGQVVLAAAVRADRSMDGIYQCEAESGTWTATWQRDLPTLVDLGGDWSGSLAVAGQPTRPIDLVLEQGVQDGSLVLEGLLDLGDLWPSLLPVRGSVFFREGGFEVVLATSAGSTPGLFLAGVGDRDPLQVETGFLQTIGSPVLPFQNGVFQIFWQGP
jgi:hypothetical protein